MSGLHAVNAQVPFPVHASRGTDAIAVDIARRCERASDFLTGVLDFRPSYSLLVLDRDDWGDNSLTPIYAMPHVMKVPAGKHGAPDVDHPNTLVVGSERGAFFDTIVDRVVEDLGDGARRELALMYPAVDGGIDVAPFANLLVIHELAHLFEFQVPFRFPRIWLSEFFANLCLHAVIENVEPESMPTLRTLPTVSLTAAGLEWKYRSLGDFQSLYIRVGAENYAWFQFHLHAHAERVYRAGGLDAARAFHTTLRDSELRSIDDDALCAVLLERIGPAAAAIITTWPS